MAEMHAAATSIELCDDKLLLRPYRLEDAPHLYAAARESIESVGRWLPWCHAGYVEADSVAWISDCAAAWARGDQYTFAIFDQASQRFIGSVGLSQRNRTQNGAGMGYWIRQSARGRRMAADAGRVLAKFGFEEIRLARIEIVAALENLASRRTAEQIGARFEGIARNRLIVPGEQRAVDAAVYGLVASDIAQA
jgi:ribosomal-protein-serine acetyltransferase